MRNFLIFLLFIFLITGCNRTNIFYEYGDIIVSWQVDNYFDLTNEQEEWVEKEMMLLLDWHRIEELPDYKKFLIEIQESARDGLNMEKINIGFRSYEKKRDRIINKLLPKVAVFLKGLNSDQIDYLEKKILKDNLEILENLENHKDRLIRRKENFFDQMENWFGEINEIQIEKLSKWQNQWYKDSYYKSNDRMKFRLNSQNQFLEILRSNPEKNKIEEWLRKWTLSMTSKYDSKRKERILKNKKRILEVFKILTNNQRNHLIMELDYWKKILEETIQNH